MNTLRQPREVVQERESPPYRWVINRDAIAAIKRRRAPTRWWLTLGRWPGLSPAQGGVYIIIPFEGRRRAIFAAWALWRLTGSPTRVDASGRCPVQPQEMVSGLRLPERYRFFEAGFGGAE